MAIRKNTAGQKLTVLAIDSDGNRLTGDAANITCKVRGDFGAPAALADTNPTEVESGLYEFDLTQAETNYDHVTFLPVSSTADVAVTPHGGENGPTVAPLSPEEVSSNYTWRVNEGYSVPKTVTVNAAFSGALAIDYSDALVGAFDEDIAPTATIGGAASVTPNSVAYSTSLRKIIVTVPNLTTSGTYTVAASGATTDGQTIPVNCTLVVS